MSFKIRKSELFVTTPEMEYWEKKVSETRLMYSFHQLKFDEIELLMEIIIQREFELKRLLNGFAQNSSLFSYYEMEKWKRKYNEASKDKNLHLRLYYARTGKEFDGDV